MSAITHYSDYIASLAEQSLINMLFNEPFNNT